MAHIGVGAFHRCHQAEYTDDLLARRFDRWGVVGINIREPALAGTLGRQDGLYTRLIRQDDRVEARVIGSIVRVVDSQDSAEPALDVLASPDIDVVTLTVTEKGYCHRPATRRTGAGSSRHRPRPRKSRSTKERARPDPACARSAQAHARPSAHACSAATTFPRTVRSSPRWSARWRKNATMALRLDRRPCSLSVEHGRPHRAGNRIGGFRNRREAVRLQRRCGRRRRAVPPVGDRRPLRRSVSAPGIASARPSSTTSRRSSISRCAC